MVQLDIFVMLWDILGKLPYTGKFSCCLIFMNFANSAQSRN